MQGTYMIFCIVIPLGHLLILSALWVLRMTVAQQFGTMIALEVLNAWASLEVFMAALVVSLVQLGGLSAMMTDPIKASTTPVESFSSHSRSHRTSPFSTHNHPKLRVRGSAEM